MEWQPIETAEKSYEKRLLCEFTDIENYPGSITVGFWGIRDDGPGEPGNEQWCDWCAGYEDETGWERFEPTHWKPLPAPPSVEQPA